MSRALLANGRPIKMRTTGARQTYRRKPGKPGRVLVWELRRPPLSMPEPRNSFHSGMILLPTRRSG